MYIIASKFINWDTFTNLLHWRTIYFLKLHMHKNKKASAEIICPVLQPCLQASLQAPMSACSAVIIAFSYRYMPLARDGGTRKAGGVVRTPKILADQKTAAAAPARRITTRHPRFSDLPPYLLAHHIVYSHLDCLLTYHARSLIPTSHTAVQKVKM